MAKAAEKRKRGKEKLEFVQEYLPIRDLRNGIIETTDNRYIKILEIEPINFTLRSDEEQFNIISSFASWLKISPMRLQFKSITRRADSDRHVSMVREDLEHEENPQCRALGEDYISLIKDVGNREALTRRFFLIFQYEAVGRNESDDYAKICGMLQAAQQTARAYFMQCGNSIVQPKDPDEATAEILYTFYNRRSCTSEPFASRVNRIVVDTMAAKKKTIGVDPVPSIRMVNFLAPRGIDLSHFNYIIMDGLYYSFLYIKADGYPSRVRAGWMSALINAGEGVDIDVHLRRENRSRTIDKVAQRIRLNRTKLKSMQDTSTDYEELANSIQAGYYIKSGIANNNEDLFYMSVFITVSAKTYEELLWRKQQMVDMLKSMDMYMSQNSSNDKAAMLAALDRIQKVEGFDPTPFAVEYTDLNTQETRKRLPVMIQMAWFRLRYPEGRIAVEVSPGKDCFVATARVYPSYKDPVDCYLAEATASRGPDASKPSVSPREWAQTAAVGIALRNAGFGLQFSAAGDDFSDTAPDELPAGDGTVEQNPKVESVAPPVPEPEYEPVILTEEQRLEQAFRKPCPIKKYSGKSLGEVLTMDPNAIAWVANKYKDNPELSEAAELICKHAMQQATD